MLLGELRTINIFPTDNVINSDSKHLSIHTRKINNRLA